MRLQVKAKQPNSKMCLVCGLKNRSGLRAFFYELDNAELLAIFLRTGTRGLTAVDLARGLLEQFGGLKPLLDAREAEFCVHPGLGRAKYAQLQAVLEMARRHLFENT